MLNKHQDAQMKSVGRSWRLRMLTAASASALLLFTCSVHADITVMMSGGFAQAYEALLPEFKRSTGIAVTTTSGASQGTGPTTIKAQIERGARPDVVILSREGLEELIAAGHISAGTDVDLATSPLGAAVRSGAQKPDVSTVASFTNTMLNARLVSMPGSTSGKFIQDSVFPRLGIADKVAMKVTARGIESTNMLARGESDVALGPVSELVNLPGVDYVGELPAEYQLVQVFSASMLKGSTQQDEAKRLIAYLAAPSGAAAIRKAGMELISLRRSQVRP
mgnify:CR=1 FL=1